VAAAQTGEEIMELGPKKEEIIELTEVAEESSGPSREKAPYLPPPQTAGKKEDAPIPSVSREPSSSFIDPALRSAKAAMTGQATEWAAKEGTRIVERMAQEAIPRIAQSRLDPEIAKLKTELAAFRSQRENLSARAEQWLQKEGGEKIEHLLGASVPRLVEEHLRPEKEKVQKEVEDLRNRRESISGEIDRWLSSAGAQSLERSAAEVIPGIVGEKLKPEIEALKEELAKVRLQADEERARILNWLEKEGREILEKAAREIFPRVAEDILRQEIARLKEETGAQEKE